MAVPTFLETPRHDLIPVGQIVRVRVNGNKIEFLLTHGEWVRDSYATAALATAAYTAYANVLAEGATSVAPALSGITPTEVDYNEILTGFYLTAVGVNFASGDVAIVVGLESYMYNMSILAGTNGLWIKEVGAVELPAGTYDVTLVRDSVVLDTLEDAFTVNPEL